MIKKKGSCVGSTLWAVDIRDGKGKLEGFYQHDSNKIDNDSQILIIAANNYHLSWNLHRGPNISCIMHNFKWFLVIWKFTISTNFRWNQINFRYTAFLKENLNSFQRKICYLKKVFQNLKTNTWFMPKQLFLPKGVNFLQNFLGAQILSWN